MCAELRGKLLALVLLLLASARAAAGTEATHPPEGPQDRTPQQKGRLSLQNTGTGRAAEGGCKGDVRTPTSLLLERRGNGRVEL